jgi:hypothetical protein
MNKGHRFRSVPLSFYQLTEVRVVLPLRFPKRGGLRSPSLPGPLTPRGACGRKRLGYRDCHVASRWDRAVARMLCRLRHRLYERTTHDPKFPPRNDHVSVQIIVALLSLFVRPRTYRNAIVALIK